MITEIRVRNFKCFQTQTIDIAPLTLLTGLNGMGKSTAIQSLLALRQSYQYGNLNSIGLSLNGELVYLGTGRDVLYQGANEEEIELSIGTDHEYLSWCFSYLMDSNILPIKAKPSDIESCILFKKDVHYLSAERMGPRSSFARSDFQVTQQRQIGAHGEYAVQFLSEYGSESIANEQLSHPSANSLQLKAQVDAWMQTISPGTRLVIDNHTGIDLVSLRYEFVNNREVTNAFRATNVGFGLTYVLPVIIVLLSSKPGTLLLLENPEAHLHPQGQSKIGELVALAAAGGVQIILETHSDHILNGVRVAVHGGKISPNDVGIQYFMMSEVDGQVSHELEKITIDSSGRLNNWPEGFFDEWDKSLDVLIEPPATEG